MIENYTPQSYPMWAVEMGGEEPLIVIGWTSDVEEGERIYHPVVAQLGVPGRGAWTAENCHLFATRDGACTFAERNALANSRAIMAHGQPSEAQPDPVPEQAPR